MRAYDLALFLLIFSAVIGLLDASGVFDGGKIDMGGATFDSAEYDSLRDASGDESIEDGYGEFTLRDAWEATIFLFTILARVGFIADIIAAAFGNSAEAWAVAAIIQAGIWATYGVALFQAKTGRSLKGME